MQIQSKEISLRHPGKSKCNNRGFSIFNLKYDQSLVSGQSAQFPHKIRNQVLMIRLYLAVNQIPEPLKAIFKIADFQIMCNMMKLQQKTNQHLYVLYAQLFPANCGTYLVVIGFRATLTCSRAQARYSIVLKSFLITIH